MIQIYIELPNFKRWFTLPVTLGEVLEHVEDEADRRTLLRLGDDFEIKRYTIYDLEYYEPFALHQLNEVLKVLVKVEHDELCVQAFLEHFDVTDVNILENAVFYGDEDVLVKHLCDRVGLSEVYLLNKGIIRGTVYYYIDDAKLVKDFLEYQGYKASNGLFFEIL